MSTDDGIKSSRISLERVAASETDQAYIKMNDTTDTFGVYSNPGTPEAVVTANPSSTCHDTTNGIIYAKNTGTGNTGWVSLEPVAPTTTLTGPTSWNPTVIGESTGGSATYSVQDGDFWTTTGSGGNMITAAASMTWTGHTAAGQVIQCTLPVVDGGTPRTTSTTLITDANFSWPGGSTSLSGLPTGSGLMEIFSNGSGVSNARLILPSNGSMRFSITYFTA